MNTPKFGRANRTRTLMIIMIAVVVLLLAFFGALMLLNGKNKNKNKPGDAKVTPTQKVAMVTATPAAHATMTPTSAPAKEVKATATPAPTSTPIPTPTSSIVGLELVPAVARDAVGKAANDAIADVTLWGGSTAVNPAVDIDTYVYPAYISVLLTCTADRSDRVHKEAYTFDAYTGKKLAAKDVFRESYLAIVKERLQTYAPEKDPVFEKTSFVTYDEAYKASDYDSFYIHEDKVTFVFTNGTLIELIHDEFSYDTLLSEARAFMYRDTDGVGVGVQIRTDIDPNRPMIAFTYDDGPYDKTESQLLKIFDKYNAKCTFFTLGERINSSKAWANSIKAIAEAGHEVESHTYSHVSFRSEDCDKKVFWTEINKNNLLIANTVGAAPAYIRMPGGNDKLKYMAMYLPMPMINWYLDTRDWDGGIIYPEKSTEAAINAKVDAIYDEVMDHVADGQIILMHSLYQTSVDATEQIMASLYGQGYQFVTVSELFYYKGITLENGKVSYSTTTKKNYNRDYLTFK